MSKIASKILQILIEREISYGELSERTGIPKSALQRYATGETEKIPIDRLEKIAVAIGTSTAFLMGWTDEKENSPSEANLTEGEQMLINLFRQVPADQQELVLQMIRAALGKM